MSRRLSVVLLVPVAIACSDATNPTASSASERKRLPIDSSVSIRVLPNLDGNDVTVTAFNRYDVVAGSRTTTSGERVFRSGQSIEYFTPPAGFEPFGPVGINAAGRVVSSVASDTSFRAFIWWHNGSTTLLAPAFPVDSEEGLLGCMATAISDSNYVAGACMPNVNDFMTEWAPDGTMLRLDCCGVALALTDNHYLTGFSDIAVTPQAFLWRPNAPTYDLLGGGQEVSSGLGVNATGWVVGWRVTFPDTAAVLWVPGQSERTLSHLGQATGIDSIGDVVGFHRELSGGPSTAFLWNAATGAHFLPGLPGGTETAAVAINNVNPEILGWAVDARGMKHAVIWTFPRS
jgi:hypothetical protein